MNRTARIAINLGSWIAITAYLVVASRYCSSRRDETLCNRIQVTVKDSARQAIITPAMVRLWIENGPTPVRNQPVRSVDTRAIERDIRSRGFVREARVYTEATGRLVVELSQRRPVARINTANGYNCYLTDDGYVLPLQRHFVVYVPIITGNFEPPFARDYVGSVGELPAETKKKLAKNYLFFSKLISFVKFLGEDSFWNAQIEQINVVPALQGSVSQDYNVELTPRAGDHTILLGELDEYHDKLGKLLGFYRNGLEYEGWHTYRYIDLRFRGQVICRK